MAGLIVCGALYARTPVEYANPLVGTASLDDPALLGNAPPPGEEAYTGFTHPGPALPHRDIIIGPINKDLTEAAGNHGIIFPYIHSRRTMLGFSSPHPGLTIMPVVGAWTVPPDRTYASPYDKTTEKASPGYYSVEFPDTGVRAELATTEHVGCYRFTFPKTERGVILIDLGASENNNIEIVGDRIVRGRNGRNNRSFIAEFSKPFKNFGTFRQNRPVLDGSRVRRDDDIRAGARKAEGSYAGSYLQFSMQAGEQVRVRIVSGSTYENAHALLQPDSRDFDEVRRRAETLWAGKLGLVEIKGGTEKQRGLFYSTLYHSLMTPRLQAKKGTVRLTRENGRHTIDYDRYSPIAFWDTTRNQVMLLALFEPDVAANIMRTHLEMARESGWMHTSFFADHAALMYLGYWERGLPFDYAAVYKYLRKNAMDPAGPRGDLAEYMKQGWVHDDFIEHPSPPNADGRAGVDKTLEYSWDDHALALLAKKLGKEKDYRIFLARAQNYKNAFDSSTGFMRGRKADGTWITPFDPREPYYNYMMKEASGWQNLWLVPHDVQGLINLLGGREKFTAKLDEFFTTPYNPKGIARDVTGMIGLYCQGNQPDQHAPYLYNYAGQPWKTQALVRKILELMYGSDKHGLAFPGMDDQGTTAAWYVMSALGFYTVNPASPDYIIGSPLFEEAIIHMGNGRDLVIRAKNNSDTNCYIQSATLNGRTWNKPWFSHADIANGGTLIFEMGPLPNFAWGSSPGEAPPSLSAAGQ
jgi:predicted alpha-1,2-mannosidase